MRNPDRLDSFYDEVKKIHKQYFPDWRFGQLFINLTNWLWANKSMDIFIPEEDEIIKYLKDFCATKKGKRMTYKEAARLINPDTCTEALEEYKRHGEEVTFKAMKEACELACKALEFMDNYDSNK